MGGLSDLKGKALIQTNYTTRNNGSSPRKTRKAFSAVTSPIRLRPSGVWPALCGMAMKLSN